MLDSLHKPPALTCLSCVANLLSIADIDESLDQQQDILGVFSLKGKIVSFSFVRFQRLSSISYLDFRDLGDQNVKHTQRMLLNVQRLENVI